jgi:hypothetical protein
MSPVSSFNFWRAASRPRLEERLHGIPVQHDCAGTLKQRPELRHLPDAAQRMPDMQVGEDTDWERVRHENRDWRNLCCRLQDPQNHSKSGRPRLAPFYV